jgi:hypothetical protein
MSGVLQHLFCGRFARSDFCLICARCGYDEPEILHSESPSIGLKGHDGEQLALIRGNFAPHITQPKRQLKRDAIRKTCWTARRNRVHSSFENYRVSAHADVDEFRVRPSSLRRWQALGISNLFHSSACRQARVTQHGTAGEFLS